MVPLIYKIDQIGSGWLAIMGRPRSGEWAQDEFSGLAQLGVTDVVSLLEPAEAHDLDLHNEAQLCSAASIKFYSLPIPDRGVPPSAAELSQFAWGAHYQISAGRRFVIHCRAGIGRSSLVAAAVLLHRGYTPEQAFSKISGSRGFELDLPRNFIHNLVVCGPAKDVVVQLNGKYAVPQSAAMPTKRWDSGYTYLRLGAQPTRLWMKLRGKSSSKPVMRVWCLSPNSALQQTGTHKVLGRGRPASCAYGRWRARMLEGQWPAAELGS